MTCEQACILTPAVLPSCLQTPIPKVGYALADSLMPDLISCFMESMGDTLKPILLVSTRTNSCACIMCSNQVVWFAGLLLYAAAC